MNVLRGIDALRGSANMFTMGPGTTVDVVDEPTPSAKRPRKLLYALVVPTAFTVVSRLVSYFDFESAILELASKWRIAIRIFWEDVFALLRISFRLTELQAEAATFSILLVSTVVAGTIWAPKPRQIFVAGQSIGDALVSTACVVGLFAAFFFSSIYLTIQTIASMNVLASYFTPYFEWLLGVEVLAALFMLRMVFVLLPIHAWRARGAALVILGLILFITVNFMFLYDTATEASATFTEEVQSQSFFVLMLAAIAFMFATMFDVRGLIRVVVVIAGIFFIAYIVALTPVDEYIDGLIERVNKSTYNFRDPHFDAAIHNL